MALEPQLSHRNVRSTNLPYISNLSPTVTDPCFVPGSQDLMTGVNGYCERRPGFAAAVEPTPTTFVNLQRTFTWDRNDGRFYVMFNDINASNQSVVYKMSVGQDNSAVAIFTDTSSSGTFDFCVSNNTLYFSNGHVAKKWDPINGVSNWGIAVGSVNNAVGPNTAGAGASTGSGTAWTNPGNVSSAVSFASAAVSANSISQNLQATTFAFGVSGTILGIQVAFDANASTNQGLHEINNITIALLKNGAVIGTLKNTGFTTSTATYTFGSSSDLWGTTWTANDVNNSAFGFNIIADNRSLGTRTYNVRNVKITIFGFGGPSIAVNAGAGSFSATNGYQYVFCYGNSNTGHNSSPCPLSSSTGAFANKLNVQVGLTASTDAQVNQIRVFRSTDSVPLGASGQFFFELPTSPYPNTTANITDNTADISLQVANVAPIPTFNDPPPAFFQPTYFAGRIWGFLNNQVFFSGLEEITIGVAEESYPSGVAGNFWNFDQPVQALGVSGSGTSQALIILCGGRLYGITGNSLDTFRRFLISNRRGCRNVQCISSLGGMTAWLDSSNQIWATDGNSLQELTVPIRPDLTSLTVANCSMTFHVAGKFHWLLLSTGTQIFCYDVDQEQWMPPWNFACQYLYSGETSPGNYQLMACTATKALQLSTSAHNDNGATYQPIIKTNLFAMVPDFGTRFSYASLGLYDEPSRTGTPWLVEVDTNSISLSDVLYMVDDDPQTATYTSIFANVKTPEVVYNRNQGTNLVQRIYPHPTQASRWVSWQIKGLNADDALKIYGFFTAYKPVGGK